MHIYYICHIMLYHFDKVLKMKESFRDLNKLFVDVTIDDKQF